MVAHDLDQSIGGVERVIESEKSVLEEDVTAHLACEISVGLKELALDQGMPCLPHDGVRALSLQIVEEGV